MVRLEDLNITFFHAPKNAGTSIETWLIENCNGELYDEDVRHLNPSKGKRLFGDLGWSFCVIRNPYERVVSWYKHFHSQGKITCEFHEYIRIASRQQPDRYLIWPGFQNVFVDHVDYVIRYENLKEDFKIVQDKVKCWKPLPKLNSNSKRHPPIKWDKQSIDLVYNGYKTELFDLNYEFGGNI